MRVEPVHDEPGIATGRAFGSWRLVERIGSGGMGEVWRAQHLHLKNRQAAIKLLKSQREGTDEFRARFHEEAARHADIDHPNVVRLLDFGIGEGDVLWMAMELLVGKSLDALMAEVKRFDVADALQILAEVADGVHAAHLCGVIHRDLKPANIFVTAEHQVKVLDFGTAKLIDPNRGKERLVASTAEALVIGTWTYMAPEQMLGKPPLDYRCDIFNLGVIAYQLLSGRHPFEDEDGGFPGRDVLAARLIFMTPEPLTKRVTDVTDDIWYVVRRTLERNREARFRSMAETAGAIRTAREQYLAARRLPPGPLASIERALPRQPPRARGASPAAPEVAPTVASPGGARAVAVAAHDKSDVHARGSAASREAAGAAPVAVQPAARAVARWHKTVPIGLDAKEEVEAAGMSWPVAQEDAAPVRTPGGTVVVTPSPLGRGAALSSASASEPKLARDTKRAPDGGGAKRTLSPIELVLVCVIVVAVGLGGVLIFKPRSEEAPSAEATPVIAAEPSPSAESSPSAQSAPSTAAPAPTALSAAPAVARPTTAAPKPAAAPSATPPSFPTRASSPPDIFGPIPDSRPRPAASAPAPKAAPPSERRLPFP